MEDWKHRDDYDKDDLWDAMKYAYLSSPMRIGVSFGTPARVNRHSPAYMEMHNELAFIMYEVSTGRSE